MRMIDIDSLTPTEKLELIGELWESLEADDIPLTAAQIEEIDRRLAARLRARHPVGRSRGAVAQPPPVRRLALSIQSAAAMYGSPRRRPSASMP
jgi:putative addiction module component (TIGR02574 family)